MYRPAIAAALVGALAGSLARNVPTAAAAALAGGSVRSCGMEAVADCAFANLPGALAALVRFVLLVVAFAALGAIVGGVCIVLGRRGLASRTGRRASAVALVGVGAALLTVASWSAVGLVAAATR